MRSYRSSTEPAARVGLPAGAARAGLRVAARDGLRAAAWVGPRAAARVGPRAVAAAVLLAASIGSAAAAGAAAEPGRRARQILADPRYQTSAPRAEEGARQRPRPPASPEVAASPGPGEGAGASSGGARTAIGGVPAVAATTAQTVLYVTAALALLLLAGGLARAAAARRRRPQPPAAAAAGAGQPGRRGPPPDADRLAAEGRYGEAVHSLLLQAIDQVGRRSPQGPPASCTSRELVRRLPLREASRAAFAELVEAVEVILFGGAPAGAGDYERGVRLFTQVVGPLPAAAPGGSPP
jgi:hypothetical protein